MTKTLSQKIKRIFRADTPTVHAPFEEGWAEERRYWFNVLNDFYDDAYALKPHEAQSDDSLVPPLDKVNEIQRSNKAHPDTFFASGYRSALDYQQELRDYGATIHEMQNILEMGVGLGRLIIHLFPFQAKLFGCDVTPDAVDWMRSKHGRRVDTAQTGLEPPLPYDDSKFDFVYANSVFTHIPCTLIERWIAELQRVIRPGGFLITSVFDANHYFREVTYRDFHRDYSVPGCRDWNHDRGVHMMTYHSHDYIRSTWGRYFKVLEIRPHYRDQAHVICQKP
jgi:SAM-dependent methyltransferase